VDLRNGTYGLVAPITAHCPVATMIVSDLFLAEPQFLVAGQTVENAARRMALFGLSRLPVCRSGGAVVGVVSERDVVTKAVARSRACELCAVDEIMDRQFPSCLADDPVPMVHARMLALGLDWVVCLDPAGKLVGLASLGMVSGAAERLRAVGRPVAAPAPAPARVRPRSARLA
jgi:CBS domain-containing protein